MSEAHEQEIERIVIYDATDANGSWNGEAFWSGHDGVTRIEEYTENGEYCAIPYVRVWRGDQKVAEFCKHKIAGVYFKPNGTTP